MDDFMRSIGGFIKKREDEVTGWTQMLGQYLGQSSDLSGGKAPMSDTLYPPVTMRPQKPLVYGQDNPYYKPQNNGMMTGGVNQQAIIPSNQGQPNRDLTNYSRKDHLVDTPGYNPFMPQPDSNGLSPVPFPGNPERAQMMLNATNEGVSLRDAFDLFNQGNQLNRPSAENGNALALSAAANNNADMDPQKLLSERMGMRSRFSTDTALGVQDDPAAVAARDAAAKAVDVADVLTTALSSTGPKVAQAVAKDNKPATIESILSDLMDDPESAAAKAKNRGQGEMWMALGKGIGQIGKGQAVNIDSIVQMRRDRLDKAAASIKDEQRNTAAASLIFEETGDRELARAGFMGVVDYNTVLSKQQNDRVNARADRAELLRTQQSGAMLEIMKSADAFTPDELEAATKLAAAGGDVLPLFNAKQTIATANIAREKRAQNIIRAKTVVASATEALTNPDLPQWQQAAYEELIAAGGLDEKDNVVSFVDVGKKYKDFFAPTLTKLGQGDTLVDESGNVITSIPAAPPKPTGTQEKIAAIMSANPELTESDATNIALDVWVLDKGVLYDRSTGDPVRNLTAGLSSTQQQPGTPTVDTSAALPPAAALGPTNAAAQKLRPLRDRIPELTGANVLKSVARPFGVIGDALGMGTPYTAEAATEQDLGAWNQGLRDAYRTAGRLTAQEITALENEVVIKPSAFKSPTDLASRIEAVDQGLMRRIADETNRSQDSGVPPEDRAKAATLAYELARLRSELNDGAAPQEVLAPNAPVDVTGMDDPKISGLKEGSIIRLPNGKLQKVVFEEETD